MRIVIFGAGAVGSVLGGRLAQGGADVVLVARPAHADAINANGLLLRDGVSEVRVNVPAVKSLRELTAGPNDVVLITAKTQDVGPIHDEISAWNSQVAVVCGTNGVEHERMALRRFANVYGMVIQLPSTFEKPGEVTALCSPTNAIVDVGRYPRGHDDTAQQISDVFTKAPNVLCDPDADVMVKKSGKILLNLGNTAEAAVGISGRGQPVVAAAQAEAKRVYEAANIAWEVADPEDRTRYNERVKTMQFVVPEGQTFLGGSTWQGLAKGSTSVETDYFNGEIALLGRLYGVPTPINTFLQHLARELAASGAGPGSMTPEELDAKWKAAVSS
jgi:2-dehydropantoate 2-reductase